MVGFTINKPVEVEVRFLKVEADVRYWEDATVNGVADEDGTLTPMRDGDTWAPVIELDTGKIVGWPEGVEVSTYFKVCDAGRYSLLDADRQAVHVVDGYVPKIMCPGDNGYGDYIIMSIGPDGVIANWSADLSCFEEA